MPPVDRAPAPSGMASLPASRLAGLLSAMEGRAPQVLSLRILQGRSREDCAAFFGISVPACDVMLLRAAQALEASAWPGKPRPPLLSTGEEAAQAAQLAQALEAAAPESALAPEVRHHARLLQHLRGMAAEVRAELEAAERLAEASPRARREVWTRRGLVALLIAAALFLYWRQQATLPAASGVRPGLRKESP